MIDIRVQSYHRNKHISGFLNRALAQTCFLAWYQGRFFQTYFGAFLGPCAWGKGSSWCGTCAQPKSHFTCSSPRCAPRTVPSTFLLKYLWAFLGDWGGERGRPWSGNFAKPTGHFTEGMFRKRQFVHKNCCSTFFVPINTPPLPTSKMMDFLLNSLRRASNRKLRTLSQNCEQNSPKLANKRGV